MQNAKAQKFSVRNLYDKKLKWFEFDGIWKCAFGQPEPSSLWLIYGLEKNGKTWFALKLADYLTRFEKVLYISAEEGTGMAFVEACKRAGMHDKNKNLRFSEYMALEDIKEGCSKRRSERVIAIDNCTAYSAGIKVSDFHKLRLEFPSHLFIFIVHEERKEPFRAPAKEVKRFATVIVHVEGLTAQVSGRVSDGHLYVDEAKALLYCGLPAAPPSPNHK